MINSAREDYRHAAARASLLYFILNDLYKINPIYQFSLKAFSVVFDMAIKRALPANAGANTPEDSIKERVRNLIDQITYQVILYTTRGNTYTLILKYIVLTRIFYKFPLVPNCEYLNWLAKIIIKKSGESCDQK